MDGNLSNKNESATSSLMELLKKYRTRMDERETLVKEGTDTIRTIQKNQTDETEQSKDSSNKSQSKLSSNSDQHHQLQIDQEKTTTTTINYKAKWEESEAKYRLLEKKYRQLETGTIKQLQDKVDQLQRDYNQMKIIKDRIMEICSCRQMTNIQFEQLKSLLNSNNVSIEPIANKTDFLQQTRKLRDILLKHNEELLNRIDEMIKKKRKRTDYEDDLTDDEEDERNQ